MYLEIAIWIARLATGLLVIATLLPLLALGHWSVRIFDFPRGQFVTLLVVPLAALVAHSLIKGFRYEHAVITFVILAVACWQLGHILPFTPVWQKELADTHEVKSGVHVLTANLEVDNRRREDTLDVLQSQAAHILLLVEFSSAWEEALRPLQVDYPYRVDVVRDEGLGLALWSRFPLRDDKVRYLVSDRRPSIFATVHLPDGQRVRFVGVHPTPPGLDDSTDGGRRNSRVRDAELVLIAREIAQDAETPWIVTGDFNDVAWSHTTRLFKRLSGLRDPRVGRTLLNSYHADRPWMRFPIDQMFFSEGFAVRSLNRVTIPGSDHFGVAAEVQLAAQLGVTPNASKEDLVEAREVVREGSDDARDRDVHAESEKP